MNVVNLPAGLLASLERVPPNLPFVLLLRHADREEFAPGADGYNARLTDNGIAKSKMLGQLLASRGSFTCECSPVPRCVATARAMLLDYQTNTLLGDPGVYVTDTQLAQQAFLSMGTEHIVRSHLKGENWPFLRTAAQGAKVILTHLVQNLKERSHGVVFLSHDTIVMPTLACLVGEMFENTWLDPLDGLVVTALGRERFQLIANGKATEVTPSMEGG
ncbi:MAG: histidine phosphatase family protein [Polyangiaceae bacterium]|nr:histidine phosphatase family protein [Polyangiaceae bacterium]